MKSLNSMKMTMAAEQLTTHDFSAPYDPNSVPARTHRFFECLVEGARFQFRGKRYTFYYRVAYHEWGMRIATKEGDVLHVKYGEPLCPYGSSKGGSR